MTDTERKRIKAVCDVALEGKANLPVLFRQKRGKTMLTIEEYLERAKYIGRIQGAAETIEDEATRDGIYGDAEYLFGYLSEDARADYRFEERNAIDELLCQTPTSPAAAETNLDWLYHHPEQLAALIDCPFPRCRREDEPRVENVCRQCLLDWMREEHTDD